ncbi:MAG: formate hydrogenlyase [Nitrospinae bacterium]|nr:formate hydrogenlyase [Nitrospinota bacterium]
MTHGISIQLNNFLAAFILLTSFALLAQRRIYGLLVIFAWQGFFLSLSSAIVAYTADIRHLYVSAALTLLLKVIVLPYILYALINKLNIFREVEPLVNIPTTMLIGVALVIFSYHLTAPVRELSTLFTRTTLAVALSTVLLGFLMMITRKKAVTQVIGFLAMENGLFFAATSATYGMPLVVELGVALDILIAALIFGIFIFQIRTTFDTLDLTEMEKLKEDS